MSDESQFFIFLPEMIHQQRKPDNQGGWSDNHSQSDQGQIYFAGKIGTNAPVRSSTIKDEIN